MLGYVKRQISELLQTLIEAEQEIRGAISQGDAAGLMNVLADAQDAAVAIGGKIEEAEGLHAGTDEADQAGTSEEAADSRQKAVGGGAAGKIVSMLEQYCELLWRVTQEQEPGAQLELVGTAWRLLSSVKNGLEQLPEQMAVVFLPYKASMWDCMESVWQAACNDPDWVPFVVPIPYFDLKDGQVTARHYEGDRFPAYVPVMEYQSFPLEEMHPSAIFVHNPFDDCNIVTTVLPEYYSGKLKAVTDRLVYIPYFITGDAVYVTHRYLPSYENMDFIVTQCEQTIASFSAELPREKFLPFGNPIADRILRLEKEKPPIPEEWKPQLKNGKDFGGDRVVMLNTSLTRFMGERERFLDKIEYLFDLAKRMAGIVLVWRPHPLLASTAQTLGEEYADRLARLEDKFLKEKIGVLDKTPDVGITVALCDAYLGETASSVLHMFGVAGKPRFYINMQLGEDDRICHGSPVHGEADWHQDDGNRMAVSARCRAGKKEYLVLDNSGWVVVKDDDTGNCVPLVRIPGREIVWGRAYRRMELREDSLWIYPEKAQGVFIYHLDTGRMRKVFTPQGNGESDAGLSGYEEIDEECLSLIRAERFKRGNAGHVWFEGPDSTAEDYFRFLQTAEPEELMGVQGSYLTWLANLDGSCGEKVLRAVKESLALSDTGKMGS